LTSKSARWRGPLTLRMLVLANAVFVMLLPGAPIARQVTGMMICTCRRGRCSCSNGQPLANMERCRGGVGRRLRRWGPVGRCSTFQCSASGRLVAPCRSAPFLRQYPSNGQLSVSAFKSWFVRACSHAGIDHSLYGIHCFRVGGMVAMQDGGASLPAVLAQGRWRSDAWTVYCRRRPATAMLWASAIMTAR
jgi:hypothetical protein